MLTLSFTRSSNYANAMCFSRLWWSRPKRGSDYSAAGPNQLFLVYPSTLPRKTPYPNLPLTQNPDDPPAPRGRSKRHGAPSGNRLQRSDADKDETSGVKRQRARVTTPRAGRDSVLDALHHTRQAIWVQLGFGMCQAGWDKHACASPDRVAQAWTRTVYL